MVDAKSQELMNQAVSALRARLSNNTEVPLTELREVARGIVTSSDLESLAIYELLDSDDVVLTGARVRLAAATAA